MSDRMSWIQTGNTYRSAMGDVFNVESLPKGIYDIDFAPFTGWSITKTADEFTFNYKIYNSSEIKHKSWNIYLLEIFKNYSSILNNAF